LTCQWINGVYRVCQVNLIWGKADNSMVLEKKDGEVKGWWGVHSQKSRMVIWTPEEGFYIYIVRYPK